MACLLCMDDATTPAQHFIDIFSEEGYQMTVCSIITKHLWLKPERDKCTGQRICWTCWESLRDFHIFYQRIVEVHNRASWKSSLGQIAQENDPLSQEIKSENVDNAEEKLLNSINVEENDSEVKLEVCDLNLLPQIEIIEESTTKAEISQCAKRRGRPPKDTNAEVSATSKRVKKIPANRKIKDSNKDNHDPESTTICDKCGKEVCTQYLKKHHQLEHSKAPRSIPQQRQCQICGAWLRHMSALKEHVKSIHEVPGGKFHCQICNKVSTTARAHRRHINLNHECDRKFKCPISEKAFKRPQELREHTSIHTSEVLFTSPEAVDAPTNIASGSTISAESRNVSPRTMNEKRFKSAQGLTEHTSAHTCPDAVDAPTYFSTQKINANGTTISAEGRNDNSSTMCEKSPHGLREHTSAHNSKVLYTSPEAVQQLLEMTIL